MAYNDNQSPTKGTIVPTNDTDSDNTRNEILLWIGAGAATIGLTAAAYYYGRSRGQIKMLESLITLDPKLLERPEFRDEED